MSLLSKSFGIESGITEIVVFSEYDCLECTSRIEKIEAIYEMKVQSAYGIYFQSSKYPREDFQEFIDSEDRPTNWSKTSNIKLMKLLGEISGSPIGPYLIKISRGKVIKVETI